MTTHFVVFPPTTYRKDKKAMYRTIVGVGSLLLLIVCAWVAL
jgi:hypothetical protein